LDGELKARKTELAEKRQLEFFVLRYMPDAVKEEFVNIGLVMFEPVANGNGFADVRFRRDWRRVWCLDPDADVEMLQALERDIRKQILNTHDREMLVRKLQDSFSNTIQVTAMKGCEAEEPQAEIEALARLYFEGPKPARPRVLSGRAHILKTMQDAFAQAGVWKALQHNIPVQKYTTQNDDFVLDCGYQVGNTMKLFHAVSLKNSVDQAVNVAYRYPKIEAGMKDLNPLLTAVVDEINREDKQIGFAIGIMEDARIQIAPVSDMPAIAETARQDLRA
jgi:hypothetical protein